MKTCPSCGKEITGRIDKKFCSGYCKSSYHYVANRDSGKSLFKTIDVKLKSNRRILKEYNKGGKATVRKSVLLSEGFDSKYFTHYWKNNKGQVYLFCYEFGFLATKEHEIEKFVLVQWQPYMET
ncbi:MAG TPA: hypothetical protein PKL31_16925 [Fulvivirga sp.]|nr:hypothetical protein [Fulvivirga sp.]